MTIVKGIIDNITDTKEAYDLLNLFRDTDEYRKSHVEKIIKAEKSNIAKLERMKKEFTSSLIRKLIDEQIDSVKCNNSLLYSMQEYPVPPTLAMVGRQ